MTATEELRRMLDERGIKWSTATKSTRPEVENVKLRGLLADCHALLQRVCDGQDEHGCDCPMWPDHGDECDLRKVERRMRELGIVVW